MTTGKPDEREAILRFYEEAGVRTAEVETPGGLWTMPEEEVSPKQALSRRASEALPLKAPSTSRPDAAEGLADAERAAAAARNLEELCQAIAAFEGCTLKDGARGPVIYDGVLGADILVLGEAPGAEEDRIGKPYVGRSGQLLDRMLASIDLSRAPNEEQHAVCLSNAVYWRPPSNRNPSNAEIASCLPFMRRFIELSRPKLLLLTGNVPNQALFPGAQGITRERGKLKSYETDDGQTIDAIPIFHPAFLLRQPVQKRYAWRDLLAAKARLNETLP